MRKSKYSYNKGFEPFRVNICDDSYGLFPAPLEAQEALDILTSYLLGDDWCVAASMSTDQCNACVVEQVLDKYSKKWKKDWKYYKKSCQ